MLIYASVMFAFRGVAGRNVPDRTALLERLAPAPEIVVDGLLSRFTETPRGSTKCVRCHFLRLLAHVSFQGTDDERK
jgi:A49-like RNA polymerase I associated factor